MAEGDEEILPEAPETDSPGVSLPAVADGERRKLPLEHVAAETTAWWISVTAIGGLLVVALAVGVLLDWFPTWLDVLLTGVWLLVATILCTLARNWPRWEHRFTAYAVHESGIDIWRGIVWRRVISVPRSRVQHTDVEQGPLQRKYGVAALIIHTAGVNEAKVRLDGLMRETALRIRDFLIHDSTHGRGRSDAV